MGSQPNPAGPSGGTILPSTLPTNVWAIHTHTHTHTWDHTHKEIERERDAEERYRKTEKEEKEMLRSTLIWKDSKTGFRHSITRVNFKHIMSNNNI